jgi:prepilin-type N-terminal cleavage/methylation domain-containing protein
MSFRKGFSLVEILIASVIAVLLMAPLFALFQQSQRQTQQSLDEILATFYARETLEQFQTTIRTIGFSNATHYSRHGDKHPFVDITTLDINSLFHNNDPDHQIVHATSKGFFSPMPDHFRRLVKLYPANVSEKNYSPNIDLLTLEIRIEWKSPGANDFNRKVKLVSCIANEEILPQL